MTAPTCPDCGTALPADSPRSLCPACLLRQALASRTVVNGDARNSSKPPPTPEEIADKFPQFEILECLGRGGMGVVYKARQKSLNRLVAIKILAPDREHEPRFAERFAREAELLARLNHPHIVTIHDFGETGGLFYLVMEFVDGVNLRDLLRDGKLEPKQALAIVPPICEALQYAHDKGIVHRDIKPENLLLDREGRIKIADFGIAALMGAEGENAGTPPYMAPEQGGDRSGIDHRADLYALGVVLYEMLTGERPGKDLIAPSRKVQIDVRLDEMVLRALEKEPERRYQTAGEFRTVVETLQDSPPAHVVAPPLPVEAAKAPGPFRRFWWLFLVMPPVCMLLGLGVGGVWLYLAPKKYETKAVVEFRREVVPPRSGDASVGPKPPTVPFGFSLFKSPWVADRISLNLGLARAWQLSTEETNAQLAAMMSVQRIRGTDLLELTVKHTDAVQGTAIANAWVHAAQAWCLDQGGQDRIVVHEEATIPHVPVSPNAPRVLAISAAAGFLLSPLPALLLILFLGRSGRGEERPSSKRRNWIIAAGIAMAASLTALFGVQKFGRAISSEDEKILIGRAKFDFKIPQAHHGWGAELPVFEGESSPWVPSNGQPVQMKDGRTLHFRVLAMAPANARPKLFVGISGNGKDWSSESVEIGPSRGSATIGLDHLVNTPGVEARLQFTPGTGSVPGSSSNPISGPGSNAIFIIACIVVLLLLIGGIVIIVRLARSKQSGGSKALGIGCMVLLLAGLLLGLIPAALLFIYRATEDQNSQTMRQAEAMAEIEAEAERSSSQAAPEAATITLTVHGAVARPGKHTLRPDATLLDALAAAGGWTDNAKLDEVYINFDGKGSAYDLRKILDGRDPNPALATGHNVFVARRKP